MRPLEYVNGNDTGPMAMGLQSSGPGAAEMQELERKALVGSPPRGAAAEQETSTGARSAGEEPARGGRWIA